ncbi:peptidyl-prolyl cis-trans isomerase [Aquifex pyrophilus]
MVFLLLILFTFVYGEVVAELNGRKITEKEFNVIFNTFWKRVVHLSSVKPTLKEKRVFLMDYVSKLIVLEEAQKMGLKVSEKEVKNFIRTKVGVNIKEKPVLDMIKAEILTEKLIDRLMDKEKVDFSEDKLRAYYEYYRREFYYPTSVKLLGIWAKDRKTALKVRENLLKGEEIFEEEGVKVGKSSWFSLSSLPRKVKRNFPSISKGSVSRPIRINGGYLVFKILDKREGGIIPFERAKPLIKKRILKEKRKEVFKRWFMNVLKDYRVKFYWENL